MLAIGIDLLVRSEDLLEFCDTDEAISIRVEQQESLSQVVVVYHRVLDGRGNEFVEVDPSILILVADFVDFLPLATELEFLEILDLFFQLIDTEAAIMVLVQLDEHFFEHLQLLLVSLDCGQERNHHHLELGSLREIA